MSAIRILILDDHQLVVEGLEQLLQLEPDLEVVGKCATVPEAIRAIADRHPHVALIDLKLREGAGVDLLAALHRPGAPAGIVLTASEDEHDWLEAVRLGARGVVLKATAPDALARCIRAVHAGGTWLVVEGVDLARRLAVREQVERRLAERLTPREIEVVRELAARRDNDEIAARLGLASGTVKLHVHHVYEKLGIRGRQELLAYLSRRSY